MRRTLRDGNREQLHDDIMQRYSLNESFSIPVVREIHFIDLA